MSDETPGENAGRAEPGGRTAAESAEPTGPQLARAALDAAAARRAAKPQRRGGSAAGQSGSGKRLRGDSGAGPESRDPQLFGAVLERLLKARGWQQPAAEAAVLGDWERVVGAEVAAHCRPVKLDGSELTVEAESTAWATQLRMLAGRLLASIAAAVGPDVVTRLHIHGPAAPSWNRGPRRVQGRGPRDTYG